jgi:hypothetical protein
MTDRYTADTINDDALDQLYNRVERAEAELARLHEGEEPVTNPAFECTPAQWIWQWNRATPEKRLQAAMAAMRDGAKASDCHINGHTERIHGGRHAEMALNEVRHVVASMENQGALQWAGWLRDAMKRGPEHCLLCATGQKTEPAPGPAGTEGTEPDKAAIARVRVLHRRNENTEECEYCSFRDYPTYAVPYPCDTVRALDGQEQPS